MPFKNEMISISCFNYVQYDEKQKSISFKISFSVVINLFLLKNEKNSDDYFTAAKLLELFHYLIKDSKNNRVAEFQLRKKENLSVQNACLYIKRNFDRKITLTELGNLTGYTPNHFQRIFTSITGKSPQKYLEEIRIKNAKFLLSQNELSIADVAYACGFSSQSYFCKTFKKATLISPIEFRNSALNVFSDK
jgi:transcriptional regulator GlxA family with amidase domain